MTADHTDHYASLGLPADATRGQVRRAYRALVRRHHPDTRPSGDSIDAAGSDLRLQQVIAAYGVLSEQSRRADHVQPATPHQHSHPARIPSRVRTGGTTAPNAPAQPPIQAGPVRWWPGARS